MLRSFPELDDYGRLGLVIGPELVRREPPDIGIQTRVVLSATRRRLNSGETGAPRVMTEDADRYARSHSHSAGNGALMRTALVALNHLDDRIRLAEAGKPPCTPRGASVTTATRSPPIAGGPLGARWGASAVPWQWRRALSGWPVMDAVDLVAPATLTVRGGRPDREGWPSVADVPCDEWAATEAAVPHPYDEGVLLGTHASAGHQVDAVVSMCGVGRQQSCFGGATDVVHSRFMDSEEPEANPNLEFTLLDTAQAALGLRGGQACCCTALPPGSRPRARPWPTPYCSAATGQSAASDPAGIAEHPGPRRRLGRRGH